VTISTQVKSSMLGIAVSAMVLSGCTLAPRYVRPDAPVPQEWSASEKESGEPSAAATLAWRSFVTDETLQNLIDLALANNRDLRQALLNVEAARAAYRIQRADQLPGVDAQGSGSRQRVPADRSLSGDPEIQQSYQAGLGVTAFELDLFGRVRSLSKAAVQEYLATEEAANTARISLVAEVVRTYLVRDSALQRRTLTQRTLETREASLQLTSRRREAGTASALDLEEARGLVGQARADLEQVEREYRQANNALGLLTGVPDLGVAIPAESPGNSVLVQDIAPGAPSELLVNRPDIRAAEHQLKARNASIGAARAAFLPRISLTGLFGSSSVELSNLFETGQRAWSFTPQVVMPIFAGGRNAANLDLATVRKDIAVSQYEQSIQTAFREVADALAATETLGREAAARRELAQSSAQSLRLSEARYRSGVDDYLRFMDAQRRDFANQSALIETTAQRQIALATLFKALGGGWPRGAEAN